MALKGILCRRSESWTSVPTDFESCHLVPTGVRTFIYNLNGNDYGWDDYGGTDPRDPGGWAGKGWAEQLGGFHIVSSTAREFRLDLPDGAGTYEVGAVMADANGAAQNTAFDFRDGLNGTLLHTWNESSTATQAVDIDGTLTAFGSWSQSSAPTETLTFTGSELYIHFNGNSSQGFISSVWVESSSTPPASGCYNPFISKTFNPNYTRRIG